MLCTLIVVTSDLGRVTTLQRTAQKEFASIVVTSDLGRVTTSYYFKPSISAIVVTSDLGRVTTMKELQPGESKNCGDVRSRTSYNLIKAFGFNRFIKLW